MSNNLLSTHNIINIEEPKMTTQINSLNEQLFTELIPNEAAVIEGGALIQRGSFDAEGYDYSLPFKNKIGSKIGVRVISDDVGKSNPFNTKWSLWLQKYIGSGKYADVAYANCANKTYLLWWIESVLLQYVHTERTKSVSKQARNFFNI